MTDMNSPDLPGLPPEELVPPPKEPTPEPVLSYAVSSPDDGATAVQVTFDNPFDPSAPSIKLINIPVTGTGDMDVEAWAIRLHEQSMGVRARMEAAFNATNPPFLGTLLEG